MKNTLHKANYIIIFFLAITYATSWGQCDPSVPVLAADLSANADSTWVSSCVSRAGACCGLPNSNKCVRIDVTLNPGATQFSITCVTDSCPSASCSNNITATINCDAQIPISLGNMTCLTSNIGTSFFITICGTGQVDPSRFQIASASGPPSPSAGFNMASSNGCSPLNTVFTNISTCADSFYWDFGDGATQTMAVDTVPFVHEFINTTANQITYPVMLIAFDSTGAITDTIVRNVTVDPQPGLGLNMTDNKGCPPFVNTITSNSTTGTAYYWDFGTGVLDTATTNTSFVHTYYNPSFSNNVSYTITVIAVNSFGCWDTVSRNLTIYPQVVADFSVDTGANAYIIDFTNLSNGANSYTWNFGDGSGPNNTTDPTHTYPTAVNSYVVTLIASSAKCEDTITQTIFLPFAGVIVGNKQVNEAGKELHYFPNPFRQQFTIISPRGGVLEVRDLRAVLVLRKTILSKDIVDLSDQPSGVYILDVMDGNKTYQVKVCKF